MLTNSSGIPEDDECRDIWRIPMILGGVSVAVIVVVAIAAIGAFFFFSQTKPLTLNGDGRSSVPYLLYDYWLIQF